MTKGEIAKDYFLKGYNCAQAVLSAFADECGIDLKTARKLASGFGAGMGRLREVCGTVTGMFMAASLIYGYDDMEAPDMRLQQKEHYARIQELAAKFQEENGSIVCRTLLGLDKGEKTNPMPDARTKEYYKKRPCADLCAMSADILADYIKEHPIPQK